MIQIQSFVFSPFSENTYVLFDETNEAILIDPGCYEPEEYRELSNFIKENELRPIGIFNTHAHIDHVLGVEKLKNTYKVPFALHRLDEPLLRAVKTYAPNYGFPAFDEPAVERWLEAGETITFGNSTLKIVFVPGHAPGHLAFVNDPQKFVIGGDVLFRQSIGRTDLPGGDMDTLLHSIRTQLFTLPDEYTVYAGHMQPTTIGYEKKNNPFFK
ncbi:MBL fold metallo-hydrolase [Persicitalea jodogahamensis]|uniref:MBL fold hydrolase n=1 Tax=Persicitalea jodogahamensis TaxID=402147 RepID=A0A8J3D466_9BACT|nr:MBL fold metallo-hydrolase [Persicitalea jodogahamensis]GHB56718.1 MBL fold hydrolase [Persicitalea jodogahamensis]